MTNSHDILGLDKNRPITPEEFEACRDLVIALAGCHDGAASSAFGEERRWLSGIKSEMPVYGGFAAFNLGDFNYDFVRTLRQHCYIFTGYLLSDLITGNKTPSWTDSDNYPMRDQYPDDWAVPYHLMFRGQVSPDMVCDPPLVAGEVGYAVDGRCVNRDVVGYQVRVMLLQWSGMIARLRALENPRILEIGGGYGGLAYFLTRFVPKARYTLVDLPSSLMYSGCYLAVAQKTHPVGVLGAVAEPPGPHVTIVPNFMAERLSDRQFDLAINTLSFTEMPAEAVRSYGELIAKTLVPGGVLFEQNYVTTGPEADEGFPIDVLKRIFPVRRPIEDWSLFGSARLWSLT